MKAIFKITILAAAVVLGGTSCNKFLDVNENPNRPINEVLPLSAKLPAALVSTVNQETIQLNQLGAFWGGYWGTTSNGTALFAREKTYSGPAIRHQRDGIPIWENGYTNLLYYQLIKQQAIAEGNMYYAGIAKIMQGWHFMRLVDIYNNIPFDDALQGTTFPTPRYESGQVVYEKSINLITEGINDIKNANNIANPTTDDILFGGRRALWLKFGNTVKLRALVRQSETGNTAYIQAELAKIQTEGSGFLGVNDNAYVQPGYLNTAGKLNPFWETYYQNVQGVANSTSQLDIRPTQYIIEQYQLRNDPRLATIYVAVSGNYKGVLFGNPVVDNQYNRASTSAFKGPTQNGGAAAGLFKSIAQPSVLMSSFESLFLQAEAAERGWISADAATLYQNGIRESFKYNQVAETAFTAYYAQASVNYTQAANKINRIIEQKWLANNSVSSIEAWSDFRRLGVPNFPNSLQAPAPGDRPLRLMYPESERQTNNDEATKQGSDEVTIDRVWWDR